MKYKTGKLEITSDVRSKPLGEKRKRGRPAQLPLCLRRSPANRDVTVGRRRPAQPRSRPSTLPSTPLTPTIEPSSTLPPSPNLPPTPTLPTPTLPTPTLPTPSLPTPSLPTPPLPTPTLRTPTPATVGATPSLRPAKRKRNIQESSKSKKKKEDKSLDSEVSKGYSTRSRK